MELSELETGMKLELELPGEADKMLGPMLVSEFESCGDNNEAMIAAPIYKGTIYPVHSGTYLNVYFLKKRRKEYDLYKFDAVVKGREKRDGLHYVRIEQTGMITKLQRRRYYRLECWLEVKYRATGSADFLKDSDASFADTIVDNLSGGGLSLLLEERMEPESFIECRIFADIGMELGFIGQIVRCERNDIESKYRYKAGVTFVKISDKDRETIVRYIFSQQRKLLKKGLV
jgi:c-di-GMP-binding flagellar brake protein YcgR